MRQDVHNVHQTSSTHHVDASDADADVVMLRLILCFVGLTCEHTPQITYIQCQCMLLITEGV